MARTPITTQTTQITQTGKPRLRYLGGTRYLVESRSEPGIGRQVDTLHLRCSCPAGRYGRRCHHLVMALEYEAWRKRQQQPAAVAPAVPTAVPTRPEPVELSSYFE